MNENELTRPEVHGIEKVRVSNYTQPKPYTDFEAIGVELDVDRSDNRGILTLKELHPHPVAASSASLPQSTQDALMAVLEISNVPARCQGVLFESIGFPAK
ncbi:uncharacterized protein LOC111125649 isoform X2 [Crassostrea virginica]